LIRSYRFRAGADLRVTAWDDGIAGLTGRAASECIGRKYHEVFPRIFIGDRDALLAALTDKKQLRLVRHPFNCLIDRIEADITITPETGGAGVVEVTVVPSSTCSVARRFQDSQRLIDIGKIASTLAHGVRNPLNAIKGAVTYLGEKYVEEPTLVEFTKIIEEEISRLDAFISRFLSTSIADAGMSVTDVNALLRKIEVFTSLQVRTGNVEAVYDYGDIPYLMIDPFQLEQSILNIINNALEAMPSGGRLRVRTRAENADGRDCVVVEVADSGEGIVKRRQRAAHGQEKRGRGFGLFIAREMLRSHGGYLQINAVDGEGTTVRMCIPVSCRPGET
jgi:two-component system nitrogen regulation sensor histidine kinase GlnL